MASSTKLAYRLAWKVDLETEIIEEDWNSCTSIIHKGILNIQLIKTNYKVVSWWYQVPTRLSKMYPKGLFTML